MAYTIKRTDGTTLAVIADGSANTATDLTLIGKNYLNYGTALNENFIRLLENFSNTSAPSKPVRGQLWYDTANSDIKIYNGTNWVFTSTKANAFTATGTITGGNLDSAGNLNVTLNANVGNLSSSGIVSATGNITGGNLNTSGRISVTGNANVGNLGTAGLITATGNITGGNINTAGTVTASRLISNVTNGTAPITVTSTTQVANLNVATAGSLVNGNSNVTIAANSNVSIFVAGNATARAVFTSTGANIAGTANITGNANVGNLGTAGTVTASRLISNVANGTAPFTVSSTTQVANLNAATAGSSLTAGTVTTAAQPNITSVGTLTSLTVSGNINLSGAIIDSAQLDIQTSASNANIVLSPHGTGDVVVTKDLVPNANATLSLGTTSLRFANIWGVASSAQYADLAEKYHADDVYSPGTVMCLGGEHEITKSTKDLDENVFGVVSTNPAYLMNDNNEHPLWLPIVLTGRANVMVTGTVSKGQWLVSAGDGTARGATEGEVQFNLVIGRSLVNKTEDTPALVEAYISTK